jgi:hypothetical protein
MHGIPAPEILVGVVSLAGLAMPIAALALLVIINRKLSDIQVELRRLSGGKAQSNEEDARR